MQKNIFAIVGSASSDSANLKLVNLFAILTKDDFHVNIFSRLQSLPHFDADITINHVPANITEFRRLINDADGILICTPEYIFSIPSRLKNAIEWCVATTIFSNKPIGMITASANGQKGHEELQLIMKTIDAKFTAGTTLLIQGVKGKINDNGMISDEKTEKDFRHFIQSFKELIRNS